MAYLDENGLEHFWGKIKDRVSSAVAPKANDADVLHKTGTETVSGAKAFPGSQPTAAGNASALLVVKDPNLVKGETPETNHYLSLGFIDSTGDSYAQDVSSRLAVVEYKSPSEADPEGYMQLYDVGFNGGGGAILRVGHDKDNIRYATAPATSDDRTNSTDIVTRGYMEASEWNWQKTKKNAVVQFKPVFESDLEPVVDFVFTETHPAEGDKSPSNPSTISGVSSANVNVCGKNLAIPYNSGYFTLDSNGWYEASVDNTNGSSTVYATVYILPTLVFDTSKQYCAVVESENCDTYWLFTNNNTQTPRLYYTTNGLRIEGTNRYKCNLSFNVGSVDRIVRVVGGVNPGDTKHFKFRFAILQCSAEEVNLDTYVYEKPIINTYTINLGDTYYGGSLDVATGVMTVTWGAKIIDGTESFSRDATYSTDTVSVFTSQLGLPQSIMSNNQSATTRFCSHFIWSNSIVVGTYSTWGTATNALFKLPASEYPDVTSFKNWLASEYSAGHPVVLGFLLNNSYTVQLTPTQIRSLPALDKYEPRINTVYTDQEAVQVGYQRFANYVDLTTDQSIGGLKTFNSTVRAYGALSVSRTSNGPVITVFPPTSINDGSHRSSAIDALTVRVADGTSTNRLGCIRCQDISSNGNRSIGLYPYDINNNIGLGLWVGILGVVGNNPVPYASAPSTPQYEADGTTERTEGRDIVTRNWIPKDTRIVHTTGAETIDGAKTFTANPTIQGSTPILYFKLPNATAYGDIRFIDSTSRTQSVVRSSLDDGNMTIGNAYNKTSNWDTGARLWLSNNGDFALRAKNSTTEKSIIGKPDGTLTWNGQTIQTTSDERLKTTLSEVPDAVLDAWEEVNWGQFQYLDAVASKGESARLHLGLIAQHVMSVFGKHGLDACAYGILCHEERPAVDEEETVVDAEAYVDEEGVEHPAVTHVETRHEDAVDLWMVRYAEAQAMEACRVRRENARLKKRIADLEERLAALELKIS